MPTAICEQQVFRCWRELHKRELTQDQWEMDKNVQSFPNITSSKISKVVCQENKDLQNEKIVLKNEIYVLKEKAKKNSLSKDSSKEKQVLNKNIKYLETKLFICVSEKEKLDVILEEQKCLLNKAELGEEDSVLFLSKTEKNTTVLRLRRGVQ